MAGADAGRPIMGAIYRHVFMLRDTAGAPVSGATGLDSEYSVECTTFSDCTNEATEIGGTGVYYLELTAAEFSSPVIAVQTKSSTAVTHFEEIHAEPCLHSGTASTASSTSITLDSNASATNGIYVGATIEIVRGTGAGQLRDITAYTGSTKVAAVSRAWTTTPSSDSIFLVKNSMGIPSVSGTHVSADVLQIASNTASATALKELYKGGVVAATIDDSSPSAGDFDGDSSLSDDDDYYNDQLLVFTTGDLAGYVARINNYTGASHNIALSASLPSTPSNGDGFCILAKVF